MTGATHPRLGSSRVAAPPTRDLPYVVHRPRHRYGLRIAEAWAYRHVLGHFGWSFVKRRYRGTFLGWLWVPLRPLIDMLSTGLLFGAFLQVNSGDRPYLMFYVVGQAAWLLYERTTYWGYRAIQIHETTFKRSPIPWSIAIVSTAVPGIVEFGIYCIVTVFLSVYYKLSLGSFFVTFNKYSIFTVIGIALLIVNAWGLSMLTGPLVLKMRDFRYFLRYGFGFWRMITPVIYASTSLPPQYRQIVEYNPLTAPVELTKYGLIGTGAPSMTALSSTVIFLLIAFPVGMLYLGRQERLAHRWL